MNTTNLTDENTQHRHCTDGGHHCESQPRPDSSRLYFLLLEHRNAAMKLFACKNEVWRGRRSAALVNCPGAIHYESCRIHARAALSRTKFEGVGPNFGVHDKISL